MEAEINFLEDRAAFREGVGAMAPASTARPKGQAGPRGQPSGGKALLGTALTGMMLVSAFGCSERSAPPLKTLAPAPLPALAPADAPSDPGALNPREEAAVPLWGEALPTAGKRLRVHDHFVDSDGARLDLEAKDLRAQLSRRLGAAAAILVPDEETYLAQASPLLAALDDLGTESWLQAGPDAQMGYPLHLRDEPAFNRWLDEPKPGKVRIIQRADGLELSTNVGKVPGGDPSGPSVPLRGGALDLPTLRAGLGKLKERFGTDELCLVPSFGTPLRAMARVYSGDFKAPGRPLFHALCLVYPRPPGSVRRPSDAAGEQGSDGGR